MGPKLFDSERKVMEVLWAAGTSLTAVMRATSLQFVDQCPETPDLLRGQLLAAEEGSKQQAGGAVKDLVHQLGSGGGLLPSPVSVYNGAAWVAEAVRLPAPPNPPAGADIPSIVFPPRRMWTYSRVRT